MERNVEFSIVHHRSVARVRKLLDNHKSVFVISYNEFTFLKTLKTNFLPYQLVTSLATLEIDLPPHQKFRHVKHKVSNLLKMLQTPSLSKESYIDFCENKEIRDTGIDTEEDIDSNEGICFLLMKKEGRENETQVLEKVMYGVRDGLIE